MILCYTIHAFAGKSSAGLKTHVTAVQFERASVVVVEDDRTIVGDVAEKSGEAGAVAREKLHTFPEESIFRFPAREKRFRGVFQDVGVVVQDFLETAQRGLVIALCAGQDVNGRGFLRGGRRQC